MINSKYCILKEKGFQDECQYDPGGYFIVNGNEKVLISQEKIANNTIQVFKNPKNSSKYSFLCEIRSLHETQFAIPKLVSVKLTNKSDIYNNTIHILLPHMKEDIPVIVLFRALGCISDKLLNPTGVELLTCKAKFNLCSNKSGLSSRSIFTESLP